jgi:hypothetical protein
MAPEDVAALNFNFINYVLICRHIKHFRSTSRFSYAETMSTLFCTSPCATSRTRIQFLDRLGFMHLLGIAWVHGDKVIQTGKGQRVEHDIRLRAKAGCGRSLRTLGVFKGLVDHSRCSKATEGRERGVSSVR